MGERLDTGAEEQLSQLRTLSEQLGPCPWGPVSSVLIAGEPYWEIHAADRPPGQNQNQLLTVALRLARVPETSRRLPRVIETRRSGGQLRVTVQPVFGTSLVHALGPGTYSIQGWSSALREMLRALQELQYVGLSHGRIDTHSFRRQSDGRIVLDFFQPLAFAELPGESTKVYPLKSPERNRQISFPVGLPSDLFAVGQLARTMLERGVEPNGLAHDPRIALAKRILARLTAIDPQDRYAHPESALHDLEGLTDPSASMQVSVDLLRREPLPHYVKLLGRQSERYRITQAWSRTQSGQRDSLVIVGPNPCERTELLLHAHRDLLFGGHFSIFVSPSAWGESSQGFIEYILSAIAQRCEIRNEVNKLRGALSEGLGLLVQASPVLRARFPHLAAEKSKPCPPSVYARALNRLLAKLAPLAIFVPDADLTPGFVSGLFRGLVDQSSSLGVLWVGSSHKPLAPWVSAPNNSASSESAVVQLSPRDLELNVNAIQAHLGTRSLPPGLREWLGLSTKRPFALALEDLDRALADGTLSRANNRWQLHTSAKYDHTKEGLQPLILGTAGPVERSSPARTFLLRAAALGPGVRLDPLLSILSPDKDGARWLEYAVRMGAVVCYSDGAHRLAHPQFIAKLLDPLSAKQKRKLHSDLFGALSRLGNPESIPGWANLCAEQGYRAELHSGQRQRIILDAIERATHAGDPETLERWYDRWAARTPEPIEGIEDHFIVCDAAQKIGNPLAASQALANALASANGPHERAAVQLRMTRLQLAASDLDHASKSAQAALSTLRSTTGASMLGDQESRQLKARLLLCLASAQAYCAPLACFAWSLIRVQLSGATMVSPLAKQQVRFLAGIFALRAAPVQWSSSLAKRMSEQQHEFLGASAELNTILKHQAYRNETLLISLADDPLSTFNAYNRWRTKAALREDPMVRRTLLIGMRLIYAGLGAYALARECLDQLPIDDRYPDDGPVPSVLHCSMHNAMLAMGESVPPRVPIAFEQAPRGSQTSLMALEIERLCYLGEIAPARAVAQRLETMLAQAPLLELPFSSQLGRVSMAYGLLHQRLAKQAQPTEDLSALRTLRKRIGKKLAAAPSHYRVLGAFLHFFEGRLNAAERAFKRAEIYATAQRALLALHWIERGRAHIALARGETSNRVSKFAQSAIYYAEQMPSPRLREQIRDTFGHHLRAARAWTGYVAKPGETQSSAQANSALAQTLPERFAAFHRSLAQSPGAGSSLFAFLDALIRGTPAERAAVLYIRDDGSLEIPCARMRSGADLESTSLDYDQSLVERCIAANALQHTSHQLGSEVQVRSAVAAPFLEQGRVSGVVYLDDPHRHYRFDADDLTFIAGLAPQLPVLVELERLTSSSKQHGIEVQDLQARSEHFAQALALSEAKRQQLLTYVHEPVVLIDAEHGEIIELSASAKSLLRDSRNKLVGAHYVELFSSDRVARHRELLTQAVQRGSSRLLDDSLSLPGGQEIPVNIHLRRVDFGELRAIQATFEDLRERNHLQEQVRRAQKVEMMGTLASGIAHDFNNFLGAIGSVAESLPPGRPGTVRNDRRQLILDTVSQASQLTSQLLDLTRERQPQPRPVNLHTHVHRIMNLLSPSLGDNVKYQVQIPDNASYVYIDPSELTQVLLNLTVNARDAMPDGGELILSSFNLDPQQEGWELFEGLDNRPYRVLSVQDTGTGIPKELLDQIFDAFFTTKSSGNGLGLATVKELVTRNHGSIAVDSQVYQGTTFRIALPSYDKSGRSSSPSLPAIAIPTPVLQEVPKNGGVLLYVEDNSMIRDLTLRALSSAGFQVHAFPSAIQALQWVQERDREFSLLVTDVHLPQMSGPELYETLRSRRPELPVLYLTGANAQELLHTYPSSRFPQIRVLQKPFSTRTLVSTVGTILQNRTPRQSDAL